MGRAEPAWKGQLIGIRQHRKYQTRVRGFKQEHHNLTDAFSSMSVWHEVYNKVIKKKGKINEKSAIFPLEVYSFKPFLTKLSPLLVTFV